MDDRAGDELREEKDEGAIFAKRERLHPPGLHVDQERDLLESDERDAERQDDIQQDKVCAEDVVDRAVDEVGVFEEAKEGDVEQKTGEQDRAREAGLSAALT